MINKETAKQRIKGLLEKYNEVVKENRFSKYTEEETKKDFIRPLFHALGWDTEDSREVSAEEKISKKKVDYGFRINGIPKFFLEAKPLKANLDKPKFAEQAINYAWHKGCTWAVLSDFDQGVKIFNAEWKTVDLFQSHFKTIPRQEFLDRFEELWHLSKEGFEQGLLDKEAEKYGKKSKKTPVGEQLLNDLTKWRAKLSKDILWRNRGKHLIEEEVDEAVQRIIDRLIFIRNCEDRELEQITLLSTMREWGSKRKGTLAERIVDVFRHFDKEYNSKLFEHHLCDDLDVSNQVLEGIINGLYRTEDRTIRYDFSALDADVLGNVYEQYLGHILKKTAKRVTLTKKHARRKEQGIYYTPTYIVDYIVRSTLGELLKGEKVDAEKIRVLDLACGSGSFLRKAFDILNEFYSEAGEDYGQTQLDEMGLPFTKKVKILRNNIFGVDLDPRAVEIAQLNLLLKIAEKKHRLPMLQQNIKCGNSLIDDEKIAGDKAFKWGREFRPIANEGGFDVVVGNPPYIDSEEMVKTQPELREAYSKIYSTAKGNWDIFCIFIEKGLSLLKKGGFFGMIVPNKLLPADYAIEIRKLIQKYKIMNIRDYSRIPVFQASVYPIVIIIKKEPPNKNKFSAESMEPCGDGVKVSLSREIDQEDLQKMPQHTWANIFGEFGGKILDKILSKSSILSDFAQISGGATVSEAYELKKVIKELSGQKDYFKFINTGTIDRYSSLWGKSKTRYIKDSYNRPIFTKEELEKISNKRYGEAQKNKIIIAGMVKRLECYLDDGHYLAGKSTTIITSTEINLKPILAILNSKLMTFCYKNLFKSLSLQGGYMRVGPPQIKKLPIKQIPEFQQQRLISLVDEMLSLNKRLDELGDKITDKRQRIEEEVKKTDAEIDESVYELYGITESEKKIIESG